MMMPPRTEQPISYTEAPLVDANASLQGSDGIVLSASEVPKLLTKTYDLLDSTVCEQVGKTAHILAYLFHSASR